MFKTLLSYFLVLLATINLTGKPVFGCACCADYGTHDEGELYPEDLLEGIKLDGELKFDWYSKIKWSDYDIKNVVVYGKFLGKNITFWIHEDNKDLKIMTLKTEGKPQLSKIDYDYFLTQDIKTEPGARTILYHQIKIKGKLIPEGEFWEKLGLEFVDDGLLTIHGNGNDCVSKDDFKSWTFIFNVSKGSVTERILGRGKFKNKGVPSNNAMQPSGSEGGK